MPKVDVFCVNVDARQLKEERKKNKERKKEESVVKYKSANIYVGRPNKRRSDVFDIFVCIEVGHV